MTAKNIIYLVLSIVVFVATFISILISNVEIGVLDDTISINWIIILIFALLLPIFNIAEIILNRDYLSKFYWLGLILNIITLFFISKFFKIDINVFSELF